MWLRRLRLITLADTEPCEVMLGLQALFWGFWMLNPALDSFLLERQYWWLGAVAGEYVWGSIIFIVGVLTLIGVLAPAQRMRKGLALIQAMFWCFLCVAFLMNEPALPQVGVYSILSVVASWCFLRLKSR